MRRPRSVDDWVERLRDAPFELPEAMKALQSVADWSTLLRGVADWAPPSELDLIIERTLEASSRERKVWGFRAVARLLPDRASGVLRAGVDAFRSASVAAVQWVQLGECFLLSLHDLDGLRECLEAASAVGRAREDLSGLCRVAELWGLHLDRPTAERLLAEAETLVTPGDAWLLAHAWRNLGDLGSAQRVLREAQARATTFRDALAIAEEWARHDQPQAALVALGKAESLASTAGDWLEVAASASSTDPSNARRALENAEKSVELDGEPGQARGRIARAYLQLLGDEAASARVGPRGVRPEAMREPSADSALWPTSASGLFDWFRGKVTDDHLSHIAEAAGSDAPGLFAALKDLCESGLVPREFDLVPHEALVSVSRSSNGAQTGHLEQGLSSLLLCLVSNDDEFVTQGVILLDSCIALGGEALALAGPFFAWHAQSVEDDESIASLLLLMAQAARDPSDPRLSVLATRLDENTGSTLEEAATRMGEAMRSELWLDLFERVLAPMPDDAVRHLVKRMMRSLRLESDGVF